MVKKADMEHDLLKGKYYNREMNSNSITLKTHQYAKRKCSMEKFSKNINRNKNSKSISKSGPKPIPCKSLSKISENRISINLLHVLLKHICKLKRCYEAVTDTEIPWTTNQNHNEIDIQMVLMFFDKLRFFLMSIPQRNDDDLEINNFFHSLIQNVDSLKMNKNICYKTILELLKTDNVELKSRKTINKNLKTEEIVFIKPLNSGKNSKCSAKPKSPCVSKPVSFSLVELINKENTQSFSPVNRSAVESLGLVTHQKTMFYKAFFTNIPTSTPELCKMESDFVFLPKTNLNPLNLSGAESDQNHLNSSQLISARNYLSVWDKMPNETCKTKEDIYKIYSCLKSIESLTRNMPKQLLRKVFEINTFSLCPSSIII